MNDIESPEYLMKKIKNDLCLCTNNSKIKKSIIKSIDLDTTIGELIQFALKFELIPSVVFTGKKKYRELKKLKEIDKRAENFLSEESFTREVYNAMKKYAKQEAKQEAIAFGNFLRINAVNNFNTGWNILSDNKKILNKSTEQLYSLYIQPPNK